MSVKVAAVLLGFTKTQVTTPVSWYILFQANQKSEAVTAELAAADTAAAEAWASADAAAAELMAEEQQAHTKQERAAVKAAAKKAKKQKQKAINPQPQAEQSGSIRLSEVSQSAAAAAAVACDQWQHEMYTDKGTAHHSLDMQHSASTYQGQGVASGQLGLHSQEWSIQQETSMADVAQPDAVPASWSCKNSMASSNVKSAQASSDAAAVESKDAVQGKLSYLQMALKR